MLELGLKGAPGIPRRLASEGGGDAASSNRDLSPWLPCGRQLGMRGGFSDTRSDGPFQSIAWNSTIRALPHDHLGVLFVGIWMRKR